MASLFADLSRGKLFGHPIHLMLVHFPAALLPVAAGYDALVVFGHYALSFSGIYFLWPGVVCGWLAGLFGIWDLTRLKSASKEMQVALVHGGINATGLSGFTWCLWRSATSPTHQADSTTLIIEILCTLLLLAGNKFGGDLILKYGVGHSGPMDTR